jgi:hypothetical protein
MGSSSYVASASAFREDDEGQACLEGLDSAVEAGDRVARAGLVDRDLAGVIEVPADERDLPKALLSEDAELEWQPREEYRSVVVAEVVGGVYGGLVDVELFFADERDRGEREDQQRARPEVGDEVLLTT